MKNVFCLLLPLLFLQCNAQNNPGCEYKSGNKDYLDRIGCPGDFNYLKGKPLSEKFGYAESLKIIYSIREEKVYFSNSGSYPFHYDFCVNILGDNDELSLFNNRNYKSGPKREYFLFNLNYYPSSGIYALELMPEDDSKTEEISAVYKKICSLVYFNSRIRLLATSPAMEKKLAADPLLPVITSDEIYKGRKFVSLNKGEAYGILRKVSAGDVEDKTFDRHDIVILDGLPNQLPVVGGVLSVPFQTPLCHISLLCINRHTPNAAYRSAWADTIIAKLENKLVHYTVTADTFMLSPATGNEAALFWAKTEKRNPVHLATDTSLHRLAEMADLGIKDVSSVGGKAANFAELTRIRVDKKALPLPEGSFAIPFWFYYQHLEKNNIRPLLDAVLHDEGSLNDPRLLDKKLKQLRDAIKDAPLDKELLTAVINRLKANGTLYQHYRFRSSTNAEDVKGFNGAGLYESKTGSLTDASKPVEKAIKAVWASLWDSRAFAERDYFKIDQHTVAMGILVHRSFGEELSNGVAITRHLYRNDYPAYTINVQAGEISVVNPPDSVTCDEIIVGLGEITGSKTVSAEYIGRSSLSREHTVLTNDQLTLLTRYLTAIKDHFYKKAEKGVKEDIVSYWNYAMDVEFKIDAYTGNLYIKQARVL